MEQLRAWGDKQRGGAERPLYSRLPRSGYQDNPVADALTRWVDAKYIDVKHQLESFHRELSPDTCQPESLDYLASLVALSDGYWDLRWPETVKRAMITHVAFLMQRRGTFAAIKKVLDIHGIDYRLWSQDALVMPFQMPRPFGGDSLRYYLRLPLKYPRLGTEFKEAQRTLRNYGAAFTRSAACYEYFYMGYSLLGDPMFALPIVTYGGSLPEVSLFLQGTTIAANGADAPSTATLPPKPAELSHLPYRVTATTASGGSVVVSGQTLTYRPLPGFEGEDFATYWIEGDRRPAGVIRIEYWQRVIDDSYNSGSFQLDRRTPSFSRYGDRLDARSNWSRGTSDRASPGSMFSMLTVAGRSPNYRLNIDAATFTDGSPIRLILGADHPSNPVGRVYIDTYKTSIAAYAVDGSTVTPYGTVSNLSHLGGFGTNGAGVREVVVVDVRGDTVTVRIRHMAHSFSIPGLSNRPFRVGTQAPGTASYRVHHFKYWEG